MPVDEVHGGYIIRDYTCTEGGYHIAAYASVVEIIQALRGGSRFLCGRCRNWIWVDLRRRAGYTSQMIIVERP